MLQLPYWAVASGALLSKEGVCARACPLVPRGVLVGMCQEWGSLVPTLPCILGCAQKFSLRGRILSVEPEPGNGSNNWRLCNNACTLCCTDVSELSYRRQCAAVPILQGEKAFQPRASSSILMNSIPWKVVVSLFMQVFTLNGLQLWWLKARGREKADPGTLGAELAPCSWPRDASPEEVASHDPNLLLRWGPAPRMVQPLIGVRVAARQPFSAWTERYELRRGNGTSWVPSLDQLPKDTGAG